jgi:Big-like domain-containing protein
LLRTGYYEPDNKWTRLPPGAVTGIAVDAQDAAYATGDSDGASAFQATAGAFQTNAAGGPDAIVVKFPPAARLAVASSNATADTQTPVTLTATLAGAPATGPVYFVSGNGGLGTANLVGNVASLTLTLPAGIHTLSALFYPAGAFTDSPVVTQVVDVPLVCK